MSRGCQRISGAGKAIAQLGVLLKKILGFGVGRST
jgi:hypothetical protein